jgi:hypothetical protein
MFIDTTGLTPSRRIQLPIDSPAKEVIVEHVQVKHGSRYQDWAHQDLVNELDKMTAVVACLMENPIAKTIQALMHYLKLNTEMMLRLEEDDMETLEWDKAATELPKLAESIASLQAKLLADTATSGPETRSKAEELTGNAVDLIMTKREKQSR